MRSFVSEHPKQWYQELAHAKFSYNDSPNRSIGLSPLQVMYGMHMKGIYDIRNLEKPKMISVDVEDFPIVMQALHEQVKQQLQERNNKYKQSANLRGNEVNFKVGDLVLTHMRK